MSSHTPDQHGLAEPLMLEKIDSLFACGVGELVSLPQIVVVGDQSSGKSSVLEGLIKKLLLRDSGLCTRFATQIIFCRAAREQVVVSIIPDQHASTEHSNRVKGWGRTISSLDSDIFKEIMQEAHEEMGLSSNNNDGIPKPTFSNDVLLLEISGPEQEHLSVIDVPGIFKSTTEGVTTKADIQLVRNMEILELAAEADVHGDRTLGVLTKPDLVDRGAEPGMVDLVEGRARQMKLGWHIIRNPGQKDLQDMSMDRGDLEAAFFRSSAPCSSIEKGKIGIDSLRLRVKEVLSSLVKKECPKVQAEIKGRLASCRRQLNGLGLEQNTSA
ncbi:Interferon-induced GTP-binding protein mx2 [Pyrenophora tritici-repentis]|nr:Interferon-induced GTP-binding protein mx2 [Pyrenophora tritici-repentis]KAI0605944.1 Interferon-induced GTP-binding protein mx2 [Pyrenophora tritici-repentis]KAI0617992.1 Interferon-induced GTP-binding protein mx2 [Pyrenophora tritici-repentis]